MASVKSIVKKIFELREMTLILIIVGIFIVLSILSSTFLSFTNLNTILLQVSLQAVVAFGMTFLLASGNLDLTVGSVLGLAAAFAAMLMVRVEPNIPVVFAILLALIMGAVIGLINGIAIVHFRINSLIFTLGGLTLYRSLVFVITKGNSIANLPESFDAISQTKILGIQSPVYVMILILVLGEIIFRKSVIGKKIIFIGMNPSSAKLVGVKVKRINIGLFVVNSILAALAGILLASRVGTATVAAGTGFARTLGRATGRSSAHRSDKR